MKVRSAIKKMCPHCYIVRRGKTRFVYCRETPKHKQRQGYHTMSLARGQTLNLQMDVPVPMFNPNYCQIIAHKSASLSISSAGSASMMGGAPILSPATKYVPSAGLFSFIPV